MSGYSLPQERIGELKRDGPIAISSENSPGWPATIAMLAIVVMTAALGNWQLNRAAEKIAAQAERDSAAAAPPVVIDAGSIGARMAENKIIGNDVELHGRWMPDETVYLDNRTHNGQAGFHVFTALELNGADLVAVDSKTPTHVLVLRGWAPGNPVDRGALPPVPEQNGPVVVRGLAQADLDQPLVLGDDADPAPAQRLWQGLSLDRFARWSGLRLAPMLVRQTEDTQAGGSAAGGATLVSDSLRRDWIAPGSMVDKHYGYAFQWFAMSAAMLAFWVYLTFLRKPTPESLPEEDARS